MREQLGSSASAALLVKLSQLPRHRDLAPWQQPRHSLQRRHQPRACLIKHQGCRHCPKLDQHIAVEEFMDWWILVRFTEADDSAGKNSYLYNDTSSPLFHYAPWDFNHSLGQTWQTDRESVYTDEDFAGTNNIFNRMMADPGLSAALYDRYRADLAGELSAPSLNGWLDDYYAEIDPSAARDWDRWGDSYYSYGGWSWRSNFTTYDEEKDYIRGWVTERVAFMETLYP
jgi:hypothetical protein